MLPVHIQHTLINLLVDVDLILNSQSLFDKLMFIETFLNAGMSWYDGRASHSSSIAHDHSYEMVLR